MALRAFIVDDEPFVRADIRQLLGIYPDLEVVAEAGTLDECEQVLATKTADVVFLDVQLRGCSGFDVVPLIRPGSEIIFVTAFDKYAVRAFEVNALDYLLKPIAPDRLRVAMDRLRLRLQEGATTASPPIPQLDHSDRILLKSDSERRFVSVCRIAAVTSLGGNYTEVQLTDVTDRPAIRRTLKEWERVLPHPQFARVHRNTIVNVTAIHRIERDQEGASMVWVKGCEKPFAVSRRSSPDFNRIVDGIAQSGAAVK
jgi:two-component system LytT family response regulator